MCSKKNFLKIAKLLDFFAVFFYTQIVIYLITFNLIKGGLQMKRNLSIRLSDETIAEVEKIAKSKKRKRCDMIRIIVERYVEEFKV